MKRMSLLALLLLGGVVFLTGCPDQVAEVPEGLYAERTVIQVSASSIGADGSVSVPDLVVPSSDGDIKLIPAVIVYGDGGSSTEWHELEPYAYTFTNGKVFIDTSIGASNYYRIVIVK